MNIKIQTANNILNLNINENEISMSEALSEAEAYVQHPCGGSGRCGKCKVIASGSLSPISSEEKQLLSDKEISDNMRLACRTRILGDAYIKISDSENEIKGITDGCFDDFVCKPLSGGKSCYTMAVDIGTTTIAAYFYKMPECVCVKKVCRINPQTQFGADVISRIQYSNDGGLSKLQAAVQNEINKMKDDFGKNVELSVITGNTTMLHLFTGLDPQGIAIAPFTPKSLFGNWQGDIYFPPCISAYVGADITTAILASGMKRCKTALLVDIGTNGEMAYFDGKNLSCCSTAAGPAFEGAGISHGMQAEPGAIDKVWIENNKIQYHTIDNKPPRGICGSGLMDITACLLKIGIIDKTGFMEEDFVFPDSKIVLSIADVRGLQLAKSAIRAGIETIVPSDITPECVYIAGGFGSYVDIESCIEIGLLPQSFKNRVKILGNAAGSGAAMILQSEDCLQEANKIAAQANTIELSNHPQFMEKYMKYMMF